jgi:hypothetical protein
MQVSPDALRAVQRLLDGYSPGSAAALQQIGQALAPVLQEHGAHTRDVLVIPMLRAIWDSLQAQLAALRAAAGLPAVAPAPPPW